MCFHNSTNTWECNKDLWRFLYAFFLKFSVDIERFGHWALYLLKGVSLRVVLAREKVSAWAATVEEDIHSIYSNVSVPGTNNLKKCLYFLIFLASCFLNIRVPYLSNSSLTPCCHRKNSLTQYCLSKSSLTSFCLRKSTSGLTQFCLSICMSKITYFSNLQTCLNTFNTAWLLSQYGTAPCLLNGVLKFWEIKTKNWLSCKEGLNIEKEEKKSYCALRLEEEEGQVCG